MTKTSAMLFLLGLLCGGSEAFVPSKNTSQRQRKVDARTAKSTHEATQDWDVNRYQDQHSFVWEYGSALVDILQAKPGERILDVGCGSGELTAAIAESSPDIVAIGMDSDSAMVERAQEQFPNLTFFQGDARDFTLEEPVDAIFSNAALHWVPTSGVENSVKAISDALKPGGRFVVEFGGKGNVQKIVEATLEVVPGATSPWYFPSIAEYSTILEKHGIEVLFATLYDRPTPLEDEKNGVKNWLRMFGFAFFVGRNDEEFEQALDQIQEKLRPHLYNGTRWTADYRRIRIIGRKIA